MFNILTTHSELAQRHLHLVNGFPSLLTPEIFEEEVRLSRLSAFERQRETVNLESDVLPANPNTALFAAGRKKHKNDTIDRLAALWIP